MAGLATCITGEPCNDARGCLTSSASCTRYTCMVYLCLLYSNIRVYALFVVPPVQDIRVGPTSGASYSPTSYSLRIGPTCGPPMSSAIVGLVLSHAVSIQVQWSLTYFWYSCHVPGFRFLVRNVTFCVVRVMT